MSNTVFDPAKYSEGQKWILFILRVTIGWHLLFEGISKLYTPDWTAGSFLEVSSWIFGGLFRWMASVPSILSVVDFLNVWGLILIGVALMIGFQSRIASICGMVMIGLYYIAHPPFIGLDFGVPEEGNYLVVNKNLIEVVALGILVYFRADRVWGLDQFIRLFKDKKEPADLGGVKSEKLEPLESEEAVDVSRREMIKSFATIPIVGAFAYALFRKKQWESWEEKNLVDAVTSASAKTFDLASIKDLKNQIPHAKIKDVTISRLIMGGNLLSGWAHSRDLLYVSQLVKSYHHKDKIFATMLMAEKCGINTLLTNPIMCTMINEYWRRGIGKIQFISDCVALGYTSKGAYDLGFEEGLMKNIKKAISYGAMSCYIQGETTDFYHKEGKLDQIGKALDYIRSQGILAGLGAHHIESIKACVDFGLKPDFWMKTMHHHRYWSADHPRWHDNMYCFKPEETVAYMKTLEEPWIAFKTLAAGAIHPKDGFRYAFESGADFICAGMYDFQMVKDSNYVIDILNSDLKRERDWRAV